MKKRTASKGLKLAYEILASRRKLRPYLAKSKAGEELSEEQLADAARLMSLIEHAKTKLMTLGFDPESSVAAAKKTKRSKKGKRFRTKGKRGGVGVYGFSSGLKIWK